MSKRSASSVPSVADRSISRRRVDPPISGTGSSSDPREESDFDLLAPAPITYVYAGPPLVGPASSVVEDDLEDWRRRFRTHPTPSKGESTVLRARQLPLDRRQVNIFVSETVLRRSSLWRNMSGNMTEDPFTAYQEVVKVISAKKGSASRTASGYEWMVTGSRRATVVKVEPSSSSQGKKSKGGGVMTSFRDGCGIVC
ncbi:hypothetical protein Bca52824_011512 [Brassica carinata]|uniref:Uncharacterized protein n=1 Tax=Brassica carinata TaxID=52824 RepID=A0A8X7WDL6_BRACI|nr:hypothetical protein Bca52824_011512 [Brassica carinata]